MCITKSGPGKFEDETCITHLAHDWSMSGYGLDDWGGEEEGAPLVTTFHAPFTLREIKNADVPVCDECLADIRQANRIEFWEDSQGFAYSTLE